MTDMISTDLLLPEPGRYVIIQGSLGNWADSDDQEGVMYDVAKRVVGITEEERSQLDDDDIRKRTYTRGDEHGNNHRGYEWQTFGPSTYFGQDVKRWAELPGRKQ